MSMLNILVNILTKAFQSNSVMIHVIHITQPKALNTLTFRSLSEAFIRRSWC